MASKRKQSEISAAATREAAAVFLEDMRHFRQLLQRPPSSSMATGLRHASVLARRILVERDLNAIAAPRVGKIHIACIDNSAFTRPGVRLAYFVTGGFDPFAVGVPPPFVQMPDQVSSGLAIDPSRRINLTLEKFISQPIVCLNNNWIRRVALIKYVAINMSAAHSQSPRDEKERILQRIRRGTTYIFGNQTPSWNFNFDAINDAANVPYKYVEGSLDAVLMEMLSTIYFLVTSPEVTKLEEIIAEELRAQS